MNEYLVTVYLSNYYGTIDAVNLSGSLGEQLGVGVQVADGVETINIAYLVYGKCAFLIDTIQVECTLYSETGKHYLVEDVIVGIVTA